MRIRPSRRTVIAFGAAVALAGAASFGFDRYVRARVAAEAERRHVDIEIGAVRPAWIGVRLVRVRVRPRDVDAVDVRFDEVRVELTRGLALASVHARGGSVDLAGSADEVAAKMRAWRADLPASSGGTASASAAHVPVSADGLAVRWPARHLDVTGAGARRDALGNIVLTADAATVESTTLTLHVEGAKVALDHDLALQHASAATARVTYDATSSPALPSPASPANAPVHASPSTDLSMLRARARAAASLLASSLPAASDVIIDALAIAPRVADQGLSLGPGELTVARSAERATISFVTLPGATRTPLALRAELPFGDGEVRVSLDGGPVALGLLGLREGVAGLSNVDEATLAGKAELVLSADDESLSFDVDLHAAKLGLHQPRLAKETLRGLDLGLRARGTYGAAGVLRLAETDVSMGAAHVLAHGTVDMSAAHAGANLDVEIPRTDCQALLDSAPAALLPTVQGVRLDGALALRAHVGFALRRIDDLALDWNVDTTCKITAVPPHLAHERFKHPFPHKVYSPRGEVREEATGPGTAGWTPLGAMSRYLPASVVMTEDGGFFRRDGFNRAQIKYAVVTDLKERRFARGASTLTMQLAKNLFLSRDKVLARKLEELVLTLYLSQWFTKDEILELYLNIVEFGPDVYGVRAASAHYFGKGPSNVSLSEALFMASMLPSPVKLHGLKSPNGVPEAYVASFHHLMDLAQQSGLISEAEMEAGKAETLVFR